MATSKINNNIDQAQMPTGYQYSVNLDNAKTSGLYALGSGISNYPPTLSDGDWGSLIVVHSGTDTGAQIYISRTNIIFFRTMTSGTWSVWKQISAT